MTWRHEQAVFQIFSRPPGCCKENGRKRKPPAVDFPPDLLARVPEDKRAALTGVLAQDPRPRYQHDPERIYGLSFAGLEVRFRVEGTKLTVLSLGEGKV